MPGIRATSCALAVVACALGLAACGGDEEGGPIPRDSGEALIAQLDQIESAVQQGDCDAAQETAIAFANGVSELPAEVSGELRARLVEASANLESLSESECQPVSSGPTGDTGVVPPETTTSTTETTTATDTTDTTTEEPPPDEDDGNGPPTEPPGGGNAGGNSGGGSGDGDDSSGGIGSDG